MFSVVRCSICCFVQRAELYFYFEVAFAEVAQQIGKRDSPFTGECFVVIITDDLIHSMMPVITECLRSKDSL